MRTIGDLAAAELLRKVQDPACYELAEHLLAYQADDERHYRQLCDELAAYIQDAIAAWFTNPQPKETDQNG